MRRLVGLLVSLLVLMLPTVALANTAPIQLVVNGQPVTTDVAPIIENDRTLVPIRALSEPLGFTVDWNQTERAVTLTKGNQVIILYVGRSEALVNGEAKPIDVPPIIRDDRTLIPVRFVGENMGLAVSWDPVNRIVGVDPKPAEQPETPAASTASEVWEALADDLYRDVHIKAKITTTYEDGMAIEVNWELYVKGGNMLSVRRASSPAGDAVELGNALYNGKFWEKTYGLAWAPAANDGVSTATDFGGMPTPSTPLEKAKAEVARGELNGVPMTKLTVVWENKVLAEATGADLNEIGEGSTTFVYWVNEAGQLVQMDQHGEGTAFDEKFITDATYTFEPLEGEIPFPAEILQ